MYLLEIFPPISFISHIHIVISFKILKHFQCFINSVFNAILPISRVLHFSDPSGLGLTLNHLLGLPFLLFCIDSPDFWILHSLSLWFIPSFCLSIFSGSLLRMDIEDVRSLSPCELKTSLVYARAWWGAGNVQSSHRAAMAVLLASSFQLGSLRSFWLPVLCVQSSFFSYVVRISPLFLAFWNAMIIMHCAEDSGGSFSMQIYVPWFWESSPFIPLIIPFCHFSLFSLPETTS